MGACPGHRLACPRVGRLVGPAQVVRAHPRVDLRRGDGDVAQQLLDHPDVGPVGQHVGGARVSEHVRAHPLAEAGPLGAVPHRGPGPLPAEPAAPDVEEHRLGVAAPGPPGRGHPRPTGGPEPALERRRGPGPPKGTSRSFDPLPNRLTSPSSRLSSPSERPTASEMRAPVA